MRKPSKKHTFPHLSTKHLKTHGGQADGQQDAPGKGCAGMWLGCGAPVGGQKGMGGWSWPFRAFQQGRGARVMTEPKAGLQLPLSLPDQGGSHVLGLYPVSAAPPHPLLTSHAGSCGSWLLLWPSLDSHNLEVKLATEQGSSRPLHPCHASEEMRHRLGLL